jgi:phage baseplate assembly protein W
VSEEFIGAGWAFPVRTDATGRIALASHERDIEESIELILSTAFGERPMRPEFGCAIHDYVFAGVDPEMVTRIAVAVRESLLRWESRIRVEEVFVSPAGTEPGDQGLVYIDIRYSVGNTNSPRNLVFPFYTIPPER